MFPSRLFENKRILVALTGGIAVYKACYLIRHLMTVGAEVRAMMTAAARRFITPLTIESLTRHPVYDELFPEGEFAATHHIELADWAEAAIFVPATANSIAKLALGICDDFVSTVACALHCPVVVAPAMNSNMWQSPAVQRNIGQLKADGRFICNPETGFLAEGYEGVGRLAREESLMQYLYRALHPSRDSLAGKTVLITAGRTAEYLDPVRMLTNPSSGRMGFALAWEAFARGAKVVLVHGPVNLTVPVDVDVHPVVAAEEMYETVAKLFPQCDIFIGAAAVADYRPTERSAHKIKKSAADLTMTLQRTHDIIKEMSRRRRPGQQLVGFAVETDQAESRARKKMGDKNLDMIVLNNPLNTGAAFAGDTNEVLLMDEQRKKPLELQYKLDVASAVFDFLLGKGSGSDDNG